MDPPLVATSFAEALSASASATASVTSAAASSIILWTSTTLNDLPHATAVLNGTTPSILDPGDPLESGNYVLNTIIGLLVVLAASALNAFGLNITKLDHTRQQNLPRSERKKEYMRPIWLAGMGMYIISQLVGSTLALRWLRPDWVAPLGSTSLIFNFLFASWLVGTPVTKTDINGTAVIILGVILILVFSSINHGLQQGLNVTRLNALWTRIDWLAYFTFLILFTSSTYFASSILARLLASRASFSPLPSNTELPIASRPKPVHPLRAFFKRAWAGIRRADGFVLRQVEMILQRAEDPRVTWLQGIGWAVCGGSLAGMCLVFTKAVVNLLGRHDGPFYNVTPIVTLLLVIITAVLQIVCLNRALECADTVVVVPLFYAGYTVFGFINSLIFYDEAGQYARWVLIAVFASIAVLVSGVTILSLKSSAKSAPDPYTTSTSPGDSMRMRPRMPRGRSGTPGEGEGEGDEADDGAGGSKAAEEGGRRNKGRRRPQGSASGEGEGEVMWEVGSISDGDDDSDNGDKVGKEGPERRGVGGGDVKGERRGLLFDDEDEGGALSPVAGLRTGAGGVSVPKEAERNPFEDAVETNREEDGDGDGNGGFGEFEDVGPRVEKRRDSGAGL